MTIEMAVDLFRITVTESIVLVGPILATAVAVGVGISLFQSITSIQDQTLTFVPKLVAVSAVLIVSAPWIIRSLMEFTVNMVGQMSQMGR